MKEIIVKTKHSTVINPIFPGKLKIDNKIKTGEDEIGNEFDKYFAGIGPSLAKNIPDPSMRFESLKDAFFSLKTNKIPGTDEITVN